MQIEQEERRAVAGIRAGDLLLCTPSWRSTARSMRSCSHMACIQRRLRTMAAPPPEMSRFQGHRTVAIFVRTYRFSADMQAAVENVLPLHNTFSTAAIIGYPEFHIYGMRVVMTRTASIFAGSPLETAVSVSVPVAPMGTLLVGAMSTFTPTWLPGVRMPVDHPPLIT